MIFAVTISVRAVELAEANAFVSKHHRHHKPAVGHRFSLGAFADGKIVGVAIVGRPVSRHYPPSTTLEVTRLATDGTKNACSALYGAAARAGKALGYARIQTYTLETEPGTSLRASGWIDEGVSEGGQWQRPGDWTNPAQTTLFQRNRTDQSTCRKKRWAKTLNADRGPA
jgi:hypothetical protein